MATGELMATRIGAAYLASEGLDVQWLDARTVLHAEERPGATLRARYLSATCNFEPDAELQARLASGGSVLAHAGIHRQRQPGRDRAARPRRLRHLGQLFRGEAARAAPRDLDRRARHVHRESTRRAERAAAQVPRLRRGAGDREQRREGAAPALHPAGQAVRDPALDPRDAAARARRHGHHRHRRGRRRARQGGLQQEGHHAHLDGNAGHVAPGRLPRRRLRGVQGARRVGGPGLDLGDERHRVAGPGGQRARRPCARGPGRLVVEAVPGRGDRPLRRGEPRRAAASARRSTASATRSSCSRSSASTSSPRRRTTSTSPSWWTRSRATGW